MCNVFNVIFVVEVNGCWVHDYHVSVGVRLVIPMLFTNCFTTINRNVHDQLHWLPNIVIIWIDSLHTTCLLGVASGHFLYRVYLASYTCALLRNLQVLIWLSKINKILVNALAVRLFKVIFLKVFQLGMRPVEAQLGLSEPIGILTIFLVSIPINVNISNIWHYMLLLPIGTLYWV